SPRKGAATLGAMGFAVVAIVVAPLFQGKSRDKMVKDRTFWQEMATIINGSDDATGSDREVLWAAARQIWRHQPIVGAGPNNFGIAAASTFIAGDVGGAYEENPAV